MRRTPSRHALARVPSRLQRLQPLQSLQLRRQNKPYGFCCEEQAQDPEKRYDLRNPPFASSLTDVILDSGGPAVKFRVRDVGRPPYPIQRRILEVKGAAYLGRCERCRGPLRWYLEDEIELARQFLAKERRDRYDEDVKRNLKIAKRKAKERQGDVKPRKMHNVAPELEKCNKGTNERVSKSQKLHRKRF